MDEGVFDESEYLEWKKLPEDSSVVGSMFVLTIKRNAVTGRIERYKARLVALGNQQSAKSYDDIKSQTARSSSVKLLIAIQAKIQGYSMVLDVKGAYLKSKVKKEKGENLVIKLPDGRLKTLHKYLYGLKQAGKEWQMNICNTLVTNGYKPTSDPLVFYKRSGTNRIYMSIHVDDFYVVSNTTEMLDDLYQLLTNEYNDVTRKSGDLLTYLGMAIKKDEKTGNITISQPAYIDKMLAAAGMENCKGIATPMAVSQSDNDKLQNIYVDKINYLKLVGLINYLASYTRPDLLYSLSRVAQHCSNPS